MKKYICLRDDDTNFYTKYDELKDGYGEFWGNLPITLATIPFVHGSERKIIEFESLDNKFQALGHWQENALAGELGEYYKLCPVGNNTDLVQKLKPLIKNKKIEVAQHGISHRYNKYGAEMYYDNVSLYNIKEGKDYLEKVFDTQITTFIPPSNTIDLRCAQYIYSIGLNLFTGGGIECRSKKERIIEILLYPQDIVRALYNRALSIKPMYQKRKGIEIFGATTFNFYADENEMFQKINNYLNKYEALGLTSHYRLLGECDDEKGTYRKKYQKLLKRLAAIKGIEFITATDYIKKLRR